MHNSIRAALAVTLTLITSACPHRSSQGLDQQTGPTMPADQDATADADRPAGRPEERMPQAPLLDPTKPDGQRANALVAVVEGTPAHPDIRGVIRLSTVGNEVQVASLVEGLPPGEHGYHVHLYGDCTAPKASAGPHLDFGALPGNTAMDATGSMLGTEPTAPGTVGTQGTTGSMPGHEMEGHAMEGHPSPHVHGDLGELMGMKGQTARAEAIVPILNADDLGALVGRAVVIHEKGNDPSTPDGSAGEAIACGVLGVAGSGTIPGSLEGTPNPEPTPSP